MGNRYGVRSLQVIVRAKHVRGDGRGKVAAVLLLVGTAVDDQIVYRYQWIEGAPVNDIHCPF